MDRFSTVARVKEHTTSGNVIPNEVLSAKEPLILRGVVAHWPAVGKAKDSLKALVDYLANFDSELPLTLDVLQEAADQIGYKRDFSGFNFERTQSKLNFVLQELLKENQSKRLYVGSSMVDRWLPGFRKENDVDLNHLKPLVSFWIGNQVKVSAHFDCPANLACCVSGKRTFIVFPPEQISNLYIGPVDINPSGRAVSLVDFENPDLDKHPKFAEAVKHAQVAELSPGDALYLPPLWWHHVTSHSSLNMLVNYWWKSNPIYMGNPEFALEHAILALRGLPAHQKAAWKALFDYYIFSDFESASEHIPEHIRGILNSFDERSIRLGWLNLSKKLNS